MVITLLHFGVYLLKTVILANFCKKNVGCVLSQEWLVRLMWNEKEVHRYDTGYNMWPWPLTSLMTLTLDVSRSNFEIALSQSVGLNDVKWKGSELIWYWTDRLTLPLDHTHDIDLGVSKSESEIAISQEEWGGRLTWNEKDVSHPFMTMILTSVTMVGWADVPDSERGDFRRRRAVDISSYLKWRTIWTHSPGIFLNSRGCFTNVSRAPKYSLEICVSMKSYFLWEFQTETLYVRPKPCFGHTKFRLYVSA